MQKSSASPTTRGQPYQPFSSSSGAHAAHSASPFQKAIPEELDHPTSQQITREQYASLSSLPSRLSSRPTGARGRPRRVPEEDDDGEGSTEHHAKLVAPDAPSGQKSARLEDGRLIDLERQLSETLVAETERDRCIAQLTDKLALTSVLLEQVEANLTEERKRAGRELRELQAKLDESLLSRDRALEQAEANAAEAKKRAGLELRELQAKLDESLLSRDHAVEQAAEEKNRAGLELRELQAKLDESLQSRDHAVERAAEEKKCAGLELRELQAKLDESLQSRDHAVEQAAEEKKRAGLELRELQAKLDESLQSRNHALEQAQSALQKASCAADANEQSQREPTEMRAELEASKSELAALRLRLADAENGCVESKTEADTYRTQTATGLVNPDEDRVMHRLMERVQAMEAEMASLRGNEKSFERMECRNEG
jgi:colicin import membrane protein